MFRVENVFEKKKWKNWVCETVVWSLVDRVKNLIEKKWLRLSDSDMVTGKLTFHLRFQPGQYWDYKSKSQTLLALYCTKSWWEQVVTDNLGMLKNSTNITVLS